MSPGSIGLERGWRADVGGRFIISLDARLRECRHYRACSRFRSRKGGEITVGSVSLTTRIVDMSAKVDDSWVLESVALTSLTDAGSREAAPAEEPAEMAVVTPSSDERVVVAPDIMAILCGTCGQPNSLDTKFCQNCGQYLEWGGATIGTSPDDSPVADESPQPEATIHRPAPQMQLPRSRPRQVSDGSFPAESGPPSP